MSSLYTNIGIEEGLAIVEEELEKANQSKPTPKSLSCLLEKVLKLNNFTFNGEHYIQIKGTVLGPEWHPTSLTFTWGGLDRKSVV